MDYNIYFKKFLLLKVEPGTVTVCAIGPDVSDLIDEVTSHLKLL